ncbi:MAG TPA: sulfur carrier protein ThiS adenylyltransferase ThiF [Bacteroidales bacterium]|nr:sulfur carrier protein ThiS adenylyltransferase ThiF [Bacteroidales bacterium]HRZ49295.1 sulfur carrier protein ThiS adenylyltransferase ThiF [Bacteroidales bacterium]
MGKMGDSAIRSKLAAFTVGIAGCGGLGSNCAVALARVGIGKLVLADFDVVEASNLNRQYFFRHQIGQPKTDALQENIRLVDPGVITETHLLKLNPDNIPGLFARCHVVVEAFDRADQKQMLLEVMAEQMPHLPLVSGLGMAGWGNSNAISVQQYGSLYVCGDGETEISDDLPPLAPRVGIVASMQANVVLEILLNS